MPQTSFALLTNIGRAKEAAALANATTIEITHIAIGDGATVPSGGETGLYNEVARKTISGHGTVAGADNVAYFDCYLAAGDGPYTIREAGLYDNGGDLIAIAHYDPPINKPVPASGQTVEGTVRLEVAFSNIANVIIVVDPSMQVALQRLTVLPWIPIKELRRNAPPASPVPGDVYVVGLSPSGSWVGHAGKVAEFTTAGWALITPPDGHGVSTPDGKVYERVSGLYIEKIALDVQDGEWTYGVAAGTANALTATLSPIPTSYTEGMEIRLKIAADNTSAATLSLNGLTAASILRFDGAALQAKDLKAGTVQPMIFDGVAWRLAASASFIGEKEFVKVITGNPTIWVRTDGNDNNDGSANEAAHALLTLQAAVSLASRWFVPGGLITIRFGNTGTWAAPSFPFGIPSPITILGDTSAPQNYIISGTGVTSGVLYVSGCSVTFTGVTLHNTGNVTNTLAAAYGGAVWLNYVRFTAAVATSQSAMRAFPGGSITLAVGIVGASSMGSFMQAVNGGAIAVTVGGTVTFSGSPAFNGGTVLVNNGSISCGGSTWSGTVSGTGVRYNAYNNGVIDTSGGGASFIPGANAGTTSTGGVYA